MTPGMLTQITLESVGNGAAPFLFEREWKKILENIQDPNTDPKAAREITIKIQVRPEEDREEAKVRVSASSKIASFRPVEQQVFMGEEDGKLVAVSFDPKQHEMFAEKEGVATVTPITRKEGTTD